jgi:precorrin-2/cobalt-factor-2 C20-methyltransferase
MSVSVAKGRLYGVGLGPGDPELVTLKSVKALQSASVVAWFAKRGKKGHARTIADGLIPEGAIELPLVYPVTTEIPHTDPDYNRQLAAFYDEASALLADHLEAGRDVALLCEGDPLFYGSFMHPYMRLKDRYDVTICAGVTGMSGCWSANGVPMTWGDDVLSVLPGTLPRDELNKRLDLTDAVVVMKLGKNFQKVRDVIDKKGLLSRSFYIERGTMKGEIVLPLADKTDGNAPYFSMIIIPGEGRRPE